MKRWEYQVITSPDPDKPVFRRAVPLDEVLNQQGGAGWELVTAQFVYRVDSRGGKDSKGSWELFFKRPVEA